MIRTVAEFVRQTRMWQLFLAAWGFVLIGFVLLAWDARRRYVIEEARQARQFADVKNTQEMIQSAIAMIESNIEKRDADHASMIHGLRDLAGEIQRERTSDDAFADILARIAEKVGVEQP